MSSPNLQDFAPLKYRFVAAQTQPATAVTLLLLPGTGGDENDLLPLGRQFGPQVNLLSVRGNVLENGMPRFFRRLGMGVFDEKDVVFRTHELADFLQKVSVNEGFDFTKLVAVGYSNGANIAGAVLLLYPNLLAGAVLWRPMPPLAQTPDLRPARPVPVLMTSGRQDPTIDPVATEAYQKLLADKSFSVTHHWLPTGHQLVNDDLRQAKDWLATYFAI
ncbi:MAG: alpha/beta hydrolase [Bernardetiaceae bacterium]|jgi:phospholipase/carboxylesterase|nr:alpha/beta hydrolase [Bernardetiaceae bacterium]